MKFPYRLSLFLLLPAAVLFFTWWPTTSAEPQPDPQERLAEKMAPNAFMEVRRAYPDATFDLAAYEQAMAAARQQLSTAKTAGAQSISSTPWTLEGPTNIGGRINALAEDPNDSNTLLAGTVTGGIFRTTNGGATWEPVFDDKNYLSIGDITYQPGSSSVVYAGTGDRNITGFPFVGDGLYKSTDGGLTWQNIGLQDTRIISRIVVDPNDPNRIHVGTMGLPMQRNNDRGLYMTTDGGTTWTQTLFVSDEAGVNDLVMDPSNSQILYASTWDRIRSGVESVVSGPNGKVWKSTDAGVTWNQLTNGLPTTNMCRISLAIDATNPSRLITTFVDPSNFQVFNMYETTDGGASWQVFATTNLDPNALGGFGWYFANTFINPFSPSDIYLQGIRLHHTSDAGQTWNVLDFNGFPSPHADKHDMFFTAPNSFVLATDGGLYRTTDNGFTWTDIEEIPNSQFYRIMPSPHFPGEVYGGMQDNGTAHGSVLAPNGWQRIFGGDGFQPLFTDNSNDIVCQTQNGGLWYTDDLGNNWNLFSNGIDAADRTNWDQPIIVSHHNKSVFYTGTYRLYRNTTGLVSHFWNAVSGDLTDGVVIAPRYHNVTAIAESPLDPAILYTGSSDGNVHVSQNTAQSFSNVSNGLPDRYVTSIKASPFQMGEVLVTLSGYKINDNTPHVWRSTDYGSNWSSVSGDLPPIALNDVLFHPTRDSVWVVASDGGVYATSNFGQNWHRVGSNMPMIPVYDMEWDLLTSKLLAGTYARSLQSFPMDSLFVEPVVSIDRPVSTGLALSPNPATAQVRLDWGQETGRWRLYDGQGRLVRSGVYEGIVRTIGLGGLPAGTYLLRAENGRDQWTRRLVKQ